MSGFKTPKQCGVKGKFKHRKHMKQVTVEPSGDKNRTHIAEWEKDRSWPTNDNYF